jgi:predicted phosphodiesterase
MAIVKGDIHGDVGAARAFLNYNPQDVHVSLGDLVDSRKKVDLNEEMACLDLLLQSSAVLIWGNHDLAYLPERPWRTFGNFSEGTFRDKYQENRNRFAAAHAVDGWLCTHAGVSPHLAKMMPVDVIAGGVETIADWINIEFAEQLQLQIPDPDEWLEFTRYGYGPLFNAPHCRGGHHRFGGIFWNDFDGEQTVPDPIVGRQIFGHSPVPYPERGNSASLHGSEVFEGPSWLNMNAIEGGCWIYDTKTDEIVNAETGCLLEA